MIKEHIKLWKLLCIVLNRINDKLYDESNLNDTYKLLRLINPILDLIFPYLDMEKTIELSRKNSSSPLIEFYESIQKEYRLLQNAKCTLTPLRVQYRLIGINKDLIVQLKEKIRKEEEKFKLEKERVKSWNEKTLKYLDEFLKDL